MNVVFMVPKPVSLAFGGQEVQCDSTRAELVKLGVQVELANYFDTTQFDRADIVHLFGSDYVYGQVTEILAARKIPYVVSSVFYPVGLARLAHAVYAHLPLSQSWIRRQVLKRASLVLPNSASELALISRLFHLPPEKMRVVPNGVHRDFIGHSPDQFLQRFGQRARPDGKFVLSVGRIEKRKHTLELLEACKRVGVPVALVGRPVDREAEYFTRVQRVLKQLGSSAIHVQHLPHRGDELANAYASAHVHALVSELETPGLASLEAALNGANLVVAKSAPVLDYLEGFAWTPRNRRIDSIARALACALQAPRGARGAGQHVLANYTWERVASATLEAYEAVLAPT